MFNLSQNLKIGRKDQPAFSLIEIVAVLFIVSVALVGILALIVQNIQSQDYNKKTIIAYQLAQEGIELIRKVRDSNWRQHNVNIHFDNNLPPDVYYMDYRDSVPHSAAANPTGLSVLSLDSNGFYFHDTSTPKTSVNSGFSRLITIKDFDETYVIQVFSDVYWVENGHQNSYHLTTALYDWY